MKAPLLELYYFEECPYCQRVLNTIQELKILVTLKNIHYDPNELQKLLYTTGRKTVPCLFIDGSPMHESLDIINWLISNQKNLDKTE